MRFLLSNDDGIFAQGIRAMALAAAEAGHDVSVCAPDRERSAASHSATLATALHPRETALPGAHRAWAVDGTPADCARLGLFLTREAPVDLVITGINRGMNMGGACIYSGTVGAAMEASMAGAQALAVSLCTMNRNDDDDYSHAARLALRVADWAVKHPLPRGVIYSLNVPVLPYAQIKGLVPATLAPVFLNDPDYTVDEDADGVCYRYRYTGDPVLEDPRYDVRLVEEGYAVITKLTWDIRHNADDSELREIGI